MSTIKLQGNVLVIDDEEDIREILSNKLKSSGVTVFEAPNGKLALEKIQANKIDVVISDLKMPVMSGLDLLKAMRESGFTQPVIMLTAFASQDSTIEALRLGAFDYLTKPFEGQSVLEVIAKALRTSQAQQRVESQLTNIKKDRASEDYATEMQIMRIRTTRESYGNDARTTEQKTSARKRLRDLFISESTSQLLFCNASVQGLREVENRPMELGYMLRVVQSIRVASRYIKENEVADFCHELENSLSILRVKPGLVENEHIEILGAAIECLRQRIETLEGDSPESFHDIQEKLTIMSAELAKRI